MMMNLTASLRKICSTAKFSSKILLILTHFLLPTLCLTSPNKMRMSITASIKSNMASSSFRRTTIKFSDNKGLISSFTTSPLTISVKKPLMKTKLSTPSSPIKKLFLMTVSPSLTLVASVGSRFQLITKLTLISHSQISFQSHSTQTRPASSSLMSLTPCSTCSSSLMARTSPMASRLSLALPTLRVTALS